MRAAIYRYDQDMDTETLIGSVVNGQVFFAPQNENAHASVTAEGHVRFKDKLIGLVNPETGAVLSGSLEQPELVGRVDPDGTVYDEQAITLGSIVLQDAAHLSQAEQEVQLFLAGGAARMTLLNDDFWRDPDVY